MFWIVFVVRLGISMTLGYLSIAVCRSRGTDGRPASRGLLCEVAGLLVAFSLFGVSEYLLAVDRIGRVDYWITLFALAGTRAVLEHTDRKRRRHTNP